MRSSKYSALELSYTAEQLGVKRNASNGLFCSEALVETKLPQVLNLNSGHHLERALICIPFLLNRHLTLLDDY